MSNNEKSLANGRAVLGDLLSVLPPTADFPVHECKIQNAREPWIRDGHRPYLVMVFDKSRGTITIRGAFPYTCEPDPDFPEEYEPDENGLLYGWTDVDGNWIDHCEHNIHDDDETVVWFKRMSA